MIYCDDCTDPVCDDDGKALKAHEHFAEVPFDVDSANAGESAVVCRECIEVREDENNIGPCLCGRGECRECGS